MIWFGYNTSIAKAVCANTGGFCNVSREIFNAFWKHFKKACIGIEIRPNSWYVYDNILLREVNPMKTYVCIATTFPSQKDLNHFQVESRDSFNRKMCSNPSRILCEGEWEAVLSFQSSQKYMDFCELKEGVPVHTYVKSIDSTSFVSADDFFTGLDSGTTD